MPAISIIVPIYKVEQYLHKCVDSILAQTFTDFELILVDDGTPDNCGKICDEYAQKDSRIVVIHKKNGGLSDARNAGIDVAKGEYIGFVDSDDYIATDMYESLYNDIVKNDADISVCGIFDCYGDKITTANIPLYEVQSKCKAIESVFHGKSISVNAVNKLYSNKIFINLRYPTGKIAEDAFLIAKAFLKADKVSINSAPKYYYVHRGDSITTGIFTKRDYDVVEAYQQNFDLIKAQCPEMVDVAYYRLWWSHCYFLTRLSFAPTNIKKENKAAIGLAATTMRKNIFKIITNRYLSLKEKMIFVVVSINPYVFMFRERMRSKK